MLAICALVWSSLLSSTSAARQASMLLPNDGDDMDAYLTVTTRVPVIGVISQTREPIFPGNVSYFAASYVQYAEMAGARVVPVLCDQSKEELTELFGKLNGLIVPGGTQDLRPGNSYFDTMSHLTDLAMQKHDETGEIFPIQYTCLGWESAAIKFANDIYILSNFTGAVGVAAELTWTDAAATASALQMVSPEIREMAAGGTATYESHHFGIWLPDFLGTELSQHWDMLSTTKDARGKVYVSTAQAKAYPFIGTQWHPEKASFEFSNANMPHSLPAKVLSQALANQFVWWAQHSTHVFPAEDLERLDIRNFTPQPDSNFHQVYVFPYTPPNPQQ